MAKSKLSALLVHPFFFFWGPVMGPQKGNIWDRLFCIRTPPKNMKKMGSELTGKNLQNRLFNRVWSETTIIFEFAIKNCLDSTPQTSKMIFLDPIREYFHFLTEIPMIFTVFGTSRTHFSATFGLKSPFPQARANKTMQMSSIKPQKHPFSNHSFKNLIFSIHILIDFINHISTLTRAFLTQRLVNVWHVFVGKSIF